jgi:hypothetical protein
MVKNTVGENLCGKTDHYMRENGNKINHLDLAD